MTENIEIKTDNNNTQPTISGMMLRKRIKEGKKSVYRMMYVERPTQSPDPQHNAKREAKRVAAQLAKEQKAHTQKEIKKQMEVFDMRFIVMRMNKFAPRGYKFVVVGKDNRIALQSTKIMGNQPPRGAFVSDISFDLIFGIYGDLLKGKIDGPDSNLYDRVKYHNYEKSSGTSDEQHKRYMNILKNIRSYEIGMMPPIAMKSAPTRPFMNKNAILVQGTMDAGMMPPKYLNDRMHKIVNETVWWTFRRALLNMKLSRLEKLRKTYRSHLAAKAIIPGTKSGLTSQLKQTENISPRQKELEQRLDILTRHTLPHAIAEASEECVSLHRQMAQLADLQPTKLAKEEGIKPSKKLKHQIQQETEDWCSGIAQKEQVKGVRDEIRKTILAINGEPQQVLQPARDLMPNVFYIGGDKDQVRKIGSNTGFFQQIGWLAFSRTQKTK